MRHQEVQERLEDFARGSLTGPIEETIQQHLSSCSECGGWLAAYEAVEAELSAACGHPHAEALAAYAVEASSIPQDIRASVEAHLRECGSCRLDYQDTRKALDHARPGPAERAGHRQRTAVISLAAAAALVVAALLLREAPQQPPDTTLANETLNQSEVIEAGGRLYVTNVAVTESAEIALRASSSVGLGEGFSVQRGARLVIGTQQQHGVDG